MSLLRRTLFHPENLRTVREQGTSRPVSSTASRQAHYNPWHPGFEESTLRQVLRQGKWVGVLSLSELPNSPRAPRASVHAFLPTTKVT